MGKSINESLALLGEAAQLNEGITKFFSRCYSNDKYDGMQEVGDMVMEARFGMLLDGAVEITLCHQHVSKCLLGVFHEALKAQDQETAAAAESLLCQLVALKEKIGGKKINTV